MQRVYSAAVFVGETKISSIGHGFLVLLGIFKSDTETAAVALADSIVNLRICADELGRMNRTVVDTNGEILVVSEFTLCADTSKGRRPSFVSAKKPNEARQLYEACIARIAERGVPVCSGEFGADMKVHLINDGPVTIIIDRV